MIPVFQRKLDDCFAACVASILEIDLESIPALQEDDYDDWHPYLGRVGDVLVNEFGFGMCGWGGDLALPPVGYAIKLTDVERLGKMESHAMVSYNGDVVHDPCAVAPYSDRHNPATGYIVFYAVQPSMQKLKV